MAARARPNRLHTEGYLAGFAAIQRGAEATMRGDVIAGQSIGQGLDTIGRGIQHGMDRRSIEDQRNADRSLRRDALAQQKGNEAARLQLAREQFSFRQAEAEVALNQREMDKIGRQIGILTLQGRAQEAAGGRADPGSMERLELLRSRYGALEGADRAGRARMAGTARETPAAAGPPIPLYRPMAGVPGADPAKPDEPTVAADEADPRVALMRARSGERQMEAAVQLARTPEERIEAVGRLEVLRTRFVAPLELRVEDADARDQIAREAERRRLAEEQVIRREQRADARAIKKAGGTRSRKRFGTFREAKAWADAMAPRYDWTPEQRREARILRQQGASKSSILSKYKKAESDDEDEAAKAKEQPSEERAADAVRDHYQKAVYDEKTDWGSIGTMMLESALRSREGYLGPDVRSEIENEIARRSGSSSGGGFTSGIEGIAARSLEAGQNKAAAMEDEAAARVDGIIEKIRARDGYGPDWQPTPEQMERIRKRAREEG